MANGQATASERLAEKPSCLDFKRGGAEIDREHGAEFYPIGGCSGVDRVEREGPEGAEGAVLVSMPPGTHAHDAEDLEVPLRLIGVRR